MQFGTNCKFSSKNLEKKYFKKVNLQLNLILLDHQLLKNNCILSISQVNSRETYSFICFSRLSIIATSQNFFQENFSVYTFLSIEIYTPLYPSCQQQILNILYEYTLQYTSFEYNILNNVLHLIKDLHARDNLR